MAKDGAKEEVLSKISGVVGLLGTVITICGSVGGLSESPGARWGALGLMAVLLVYVEFAAKAEDSSATLPGTTPQRHKRSGLWYGAVFLLVAWGVTECAWSVIGRSSKAEVDIIESRFLPEDLVAQSLAMVKKGTGVAVTCETAFDNPAPMLGALDVLFAGSHFVAPASIDKSSVENLYDRYDCDISFDIIKAHGVGSLAVDDVRVVVEDYKPLPRFVCEAPGAAARPSVDGMLVYQLDRIDCKDLPKTISPTWYLPDVTSRAVLVWNKLSRPRLTSTDPVGLHIQLMASTPGAYRIRVEAIVRPPFGKQQVIEIVGKPQWVAFVDVEAVDSVDDGLLKQYGYERPVVEGRRGSWWEIVPIPEVPAGKDSE